MGWRITLEWSSNEIQSGRERDRSVDKRDSSAWREAKRENICYSSTFIELQLLKSCFLTVGDGFLHVKSVSHTPTVL